MNRGQGGRANPGLAAKLEAERRLKEGISGHKTGLPKKLLDLFEPLPWDDKVTALRKRKPAVPYTGFAQYVSQFAEPGDPEYEPQAEQPRPSSPRRFRNPEMPAQARVDAESKVEKKTRLTIEKVHKAEEQIEEGLKEWDPTKDPTIEGDPFKTLFVGRLSYDATEKKLKREFEEYGPVKRVRLVLDKNTSKPRGYAFVEFEHKSDMKAAYKAADGRKVEGRRILVDVERGRTVPNWRPRRFGGGKGGESRAPKLPKDPAKRAAAQAAIAAAAAIAAPETKVVPDREKARDKQREKDIEKVREREAGKDRVREEKAKSRDKDKDKDRERAEKDKDKERVDKDRDRRDKDRARDKDKLREPEKAGEGERGERENGKAKEDGREHRERKRERDAPRSAGREREATQEEERASKRSREEDSSRRRRERDVLA
ncbi:hypothetical protein WJX72_002268 [[Myrmecia] bisecta]|uniref:RRM domain-containing protein n=1 Tax=[Myrmecia] bisecta TaxID=41462 RepID=A0AAW1PPE0_9CHLO